METRARPDDSMSLLTDLFRSAVDDDEYRDAARSRPAPAATGDATGDGTGDRTGAGTSEVSTSPWRTPRVRAAVLLTVGVAVLGLLLATTAIQTRRSAPAAAAQRASLVERIDVVRGQTEDLRAEVAGAERALEEARELVLASTVEGEAAAAFLAELELTGGATPLVGPGLVVTLDDADADDGGLEGDDGAASDGRVQDVDLRQVLNGLWAAGAEAVAVDGTRVTSRTSVRVAGEALFVDLAPLRPPYEVVAIGDPETLAPRFLDSAGASWVQSIATLYGVGFEVATRPEVSVPGAAGTELVWSRVPTRTDQ